MGSTRYVNMKLTPDKQFKNFYWLEGPLEGDRGSRITVLHAGQEKECSHFLRREVDCPGAGVGKVNMCQDWDSKRTHGRLHEAPLPSPPLYELEDEVYSDPVSSAW